MATARARPPAPTRLVRVLKTDLGPAPLSQLRARRSQENGSVLLQWGSPPQLDFSVPSSFADCGSRLHDPLIIDGEMRPVEIVQLAREEGFSAPPLSGLQPLGKPHPQLPSQGQPDEHLEAPGLTEFLLFTVYRFCALTAGGAIRHIEW